MKYFYAVEYISGRGTTTGQPNQKTGYMSIATDSVAFASKKERDAWVADGEYTSDMRGNSRAAVSLRQLRNLCLGMSIDEFAEHIQYLPYSTPQND